ncbi:MAG TPA: hypothetical protein VN154_07440 [Rhizomicrobium sp.]|nr:hypothetical protein [Rhizomicrobium sp.]
MAIRGLLVVWGLLFVASPVLAEDCPTHDHQEIESLLTKAPSCDRSMALFEACEFGTSGDISFGEIVIKKCEGVFLDRLSMSERRTYERKIRACWHKYAKEDGTMYRSFEAFCAAGIAQRYARNAGKAKK